jgi:hypothetical protein
VRCRPAQMMRAKGRESRCTREELMASSVTSSAICWNMNTSLRTCFKMLVWRMVVEGDVLSRFRLLRHSDRSGGKPEGGKDVRVKVSYCPLREALEHRWSSITRRQTKSFNPAAVFMILGGDDERISLSAFTVLMTERNSPVGVPKCSSGSSPR